ncbi:MAG: diguanylate cyclase [Solirubrobacterales bacterium]|nr:diguanylate cyclase [Solirubrobacterales bacterium]
MSFRNRLTLFFVLIVIVPMVSVAFVLFRLIDDNESGKADARVAAQQQAAINLFAEERDRAEEVLGEVGSDNVLAQALQTGDDARAAKRARQLVRFRDIERIAIVDGGRIVLSAGDPEAVAPAARPLRNRSGRSFGRLEVSVIDATAYARRVRRVTGLETIVRRGDGLLAGTLASAGDEALPRLGEVEVGGRDYRVASFDAPGFASASVRVSTLGSQAGTDTDVATSRLYAGGILLGFLVLAVIFAVGVSRSLQQQIAGFLDAARRLGAGDFSAKVPTTGNDEFSALGEEFNSMSRQLEARLEELSQERERVQGSMRRLGEAVASNLDRDALLEIVVRTAVDGVAADAGRASVCGEDLATLEERVSIGSMGGLARAMESVEIDALRAGRPREATAGDASAIAHPLRGADGGESVVGVVSVGRAGRPFTPSERELLHYLAGQAAVSMENVDLHETVARESITDELTGLANRRGFGDALSREVERSKRFGDPMGLVLLDLDDFKDINDNHGHQQGDVVLREVARVLRETSREVDEPARYGGEELALVLPGTDLDGAFNLAERVRERIARLRVARLGDPGTLQVTASFGVAALPATASDEEGLVAAADAALYEAKRGGKNKSVRAQ